MYKKPLLVLTSSALVGLVAAYLVTRLNDPPLPELPATVFVSADQQSLVELPEEPKPLPPESAEPPPLPVLLRPEPLPAPPDGREVTVSLRQPEETTDEEPVIELLAAPKKEKPLGLLVADPEEAPPSPELLPMPAEEAGDTETFTMPSGHYLQHRPKYVPPTPSALELLPMPEEEPAMSKTDGPQPLPAVVFAVSRPSASARGEGVPLTGTYACSLEDKTRLPLPDTVQEQIGKRAHAFYVGLAPDRKCLWVYTNVGVDRLVRHLIDPSNAGAEALYNLRTCLSRLESVPGDPDHVLSLPAYMVEAAKLDKEVIVIGVRDHLELWDAKNWEEYSNRKSQADAGRMGELLRTAEQSGPIGPEWNRMW